MSRLVRQGSVAALLGSLLAIQCPATLAAPADEAVRRAFVEAMAAVEAGTAGAADDAQSLREYVLYPYLESARLGDRSAARLRDHGIAHRTVRSDGDDELHGRLAPRLELRFGIQRVDLGEHFGRHHLGRGDRQRRGRRRYQNA